MKIQEHQYLCQLEARDNNQRWIFLEILAKNI